MTHTLNTHELNAVADLVNANDVLDTYHSGKAEYDSEWSEPEDGVEALIIAMDRTTAEHLFLQAQRDIRRDAAKALMAAQE